MYFCFIKYDLCLCQAFEVVSKGQGLSLLWKKLDLFVSGRLLTPLRYTSTFLCVSLSLSRCGVVVWPGCWHVDAGAGPVGFPAWETAGAGHSRRAAQETPGAVCAAPSLTGRGQTGNICLAVCLSDWLSVSLSAHAETHSGDLCLKFQIMIQLCQQRTKQPRCYGFFLTHLHI